MPGWKEHVADLYNASRELREMWLGAGKPKQGPLFELHKNAKARCKYAIRYIQNNENIMRKESLAKELSHLDAKSFWKDIKMMTCSSTLANYYRRCVRWCCHCSKLEKSL